MVRWFQPQRAPGTTPEQVHVVVRTLKEPADLAFADRPVGKLAHSSVDLGDVVLLAILMGLVVVWTSNRQCEWLSPAPAVTLPPAMASPAVPPRAPTGRPLRPSVVPRRGAQQAEVVLKVDVDPSGRPIGVSVVRGSGGTIDRRAMEQVLRQQFEPARPEGVPVPSQIQVTVKVPIT